MKKTWLILLMVVTNWCYAATLNKLTIMLDWPLNPDHAPLIIAQQQGYFKEQGLIVDLIDPTKANDAPKAITNHQADIGLSYEPDYLEQVDRGLPLIRFGTLIDKPLNSLITLKNSKINTIRGLKGKRIGTDDSRLSNAILITLLEKAGMSTKDVTIVPVKNDLTQALLTHQVDAMTGLSRNYEIAMMEAKHQHLVTFFPEDNGLPNFSELILVTHIDRVTDQRLSRFLAAIKKAVAYLDEHPKETWMQFAKAHPNENTVINREAWFTTLPYFAEDPTAMDTNEVLEFAAFMQKNHLINKIQPASRYRVIIN